MNKKLLSEVFTIFPTEGGKDKAPLLIRDENNNPILKKNGEESRFHWPKVKKKKLSLQEIEKYTTFGVCCGVNGLEVIDIDNHDGKATEYYNFISDNIDLKKYLIVNTQSGGYHIYYYCNNPGGSAKLASKIFNDKKITLIETKGVGGYVVFYDNIINGNISEVPFIGIEERDDLLSICGSFNEIDPTPEDKKEHKKYNSVDGERPGDLYLNDPETIQETKDLLLNAGWTENGSFHWTRPGKTKGTSATFGKVGLNKFYVFSENADPFPARESFTMLKVRAILLHNDNMSECIKELADRYGVKKSTKKESIQEPESKIKTKHDVLREILNQWKIQVRYNDIHKRYEFSYGDRWSTDTDFMCGRIANEMEDKRNIINNKGQKKPISISVKKVFEMTQSSSISKFYNPVKDFFESLPKYNGKDNFKELMKYIKLTGDEDVEFFISMLKKHIIRACKCALIENYINRLVLVFHGSQEIGKSKFWQWIIPDELYYDDPIDPTNKDSILALSRYIIVNIEELDGLRKDEVAKLKAFISRGVITKRLSYGRNDNKFERRASLVASTNESEILIDTSNTRWIILKLKGFDWRGYLKNIDPKMLWSQAYHEFKKDSEAGELTTEEKDNREIRNNKEFLETSAEGELLTKHFVEGDMKYSSTEIFDALQKKYYSVRMSMPRMRRELKRLFGKPHNTRKDGNPGRYYYLQEKNIDIEAESGQSFNDYMNSEAREIEQEKQGEIPF